MMNIMWKVTCSSLKEKVNKVIQFSTIGQELYESTKCLQSSANPGNLYE